MTDRDGVCFIKRNEKITKKEVPEKFGDLLAKHMKVEEFIGRQKHTAKVIPADELEKHDTALFELNHEFEIHYTLSDIMVDFEVDRKAGEVTVKKLWRYQGKYEMETRIYYIENYNKTWRAWTAVPTKDAMAAEEWK